MSRSASTAGGRLVSVIIPAHNAEHTVAQAIQSALDQTCGDTEVLVIDDNSSDRTADMANSFDTKNVRVWRCSAGNASASRNVGLQHASGRYIQFLDADDVLHPEKIELQLTALGKECATATLASASWMKFRHEVSEAQLTAEPVWPIEDPVEWLITSLSGGGMMQTGAWLTPRELIDAAGPWDETLTLHDDGEFFTRVLLQSKRIQFVPEALIYYRSVADSLSRRRDNQAAQSAFRVCQLREQHLLSRRDDQRTRSALATQYAQFSYEFSGLAPALAVQALDRTLTLGGGRLGDVGGANFRRMTRLFGFRTALKVKTMLSNLTQGTRFE